jgi:hypothetical protein
MTLGGLTSCVAVDSELAVLILTHVFVLKTCRLIGSAALAFVERPAGHSAGYLGNPC